ncbi:MAG: HNH endonuclease, partial [Sterolibacterium sp.]
CHARFFFLGAGKFMGRLKELKPRLREARTAVAAYPEKKADSFYSSAEWKGLRLECLRRDRFICVKCGAPAKVADHITSRKDGGADSLENLRSLCRTCDNQSKEDSSGQRRGKRTF